MKKIIALAIFSSILAYVIHGCADIGNQAPPASPDTALVSYNDDIQPLFDEFCATPACHGAAIAPHYLDLTTYAGLIDSIGPNAPVIIKAEPNSSYLVKRITFDNPPTEPRMPLTGPPYLTQAQIDTITQWIAEGALDN